MSLQAVLLNISCRLETPGELKKKILMSRSIKSESLRLDGTQLLVDLFVCLFSFYARTCSVWNTAGAG